MRIEKVDSATNEEWDAIWSTCDYATYFHSREWAEIWQAYTKNFMKPAPIMVFFSDGQRVLLPFSMQLRKGLIKNYFSSPEGTFGGWISEHSLSKAHADLLVDFIMEKTKNIVWRINPYDEPFALEILAEKKNYFRIDEDDTHVVDLTQGFENNRRKWSKGHKSAAEKARRDGVIIKIANAEDDWQEYFNVYVDSHRRWGKSAQVFYEKELFSIMYRLQSKHIILWLATYMNRIVAGALCFYAKKHVVYWHGAALEDYFYLRPANLLISDIIKASCENGYHWFDFNPSGGIEGVRAFKKSFNTLILSAPVVTQKTNFIKFYITFKKLFGM